MSIDGAKTAAPFTVRMRSRSSLQLSQAARCISTSYLALPSRDPCNRSGSISWISVSMHLFIFQKLLDRPDRIVIVNTRCSFGGPNDLGDLLVGQSLLNSQCEHFPLCRRKRVERFPHSFLSFLGDQSIKSSVLADLIRLLHRNRFPAPSFCPSAIEHQSPFDREEPRSQ